jgi:hypothetical protein
MQIFTVFVLCVVLGVTICVFKLSYVEDEYISLKTYPEKITTSYGSNLCNGPAGGQLNGRNMQSELCTRPLCNVSFPFAVLPSSAYLRQVSRLFICT